MGRFYIQRIRNFSYPCRVCSRKHESVYLAELCADDDLKRMASGNKHLVPLKGNEHLVNKVK